MDFDPIQGKHHIFAIQSLLCFDHQAFPGEDIHYGQQTKLSSVRQLIRHKIHRPPLIRAHWMKVFTPVLRYPATAFLPLMQC